MPGIILVMIMYPSACALARSLTYLAVAARASASFFASSALTARGGGAAEAVLSWCPVSGGGAAGVAGLSEQAARPSRAIAVATAAILRMALTGRSTGRGC